MTRRIRVQGSYVSSMNMFKFFNRSLSLQFYLMEVALNIIGRKIGHIAGKIVQLLLIVHLNM